MEDSVHRLPVSQCVSYFCSRPFTDVVPDMGVASVVEPWRQVKETNTEPYVVRDERMTSGCKEIAWLLHEMPCEPRQVTHISRKLCLKWKTPEWVSGKQVVRLAPKARGSV